MLTRAAYGQPQFSAALARLRERGEADFAKVEPAVREVLAEVRQGGDAAVARFVERFEHRTPATLARDAWDGEGALARLAPEVRAALELSAERIADFHVREREAMFPEGGFRYE